MLWLFRSLKLEVLTKLHAADDKCLDDLFLLFSQIHADDKVPDACRVRDDLLQRCVVNRIIQVSLPMQAWFSVSVNEHFEINWSAMPLLSLKWEDGKLKSITHMCSTRPQTLKPHVYKCLEPPQNYII